MLNKKLVVIFVLAGILLLFFAKDFLGRNEEEEKSWVTIRGEKIQVEIAKTDEERQRGLSGRDSLCRECGMLFEFDDPGRYGFWMKEMSFPLDIIWILDYNVVYIKKDVSQDFQGVLRPSVLANRVLELPVGTVERLGIKIGDSIKAKEVFFYNKEDCFGQE